MDKKDKLINHFIKYGNILDRLSLKQIQKIDKKFDLNKFNISKTNIQALFFSIDYEQRLKLYSSKIDKKNLNNNNSQYVRIHPPFMFRTTDSQELQSDMNIFFNNLDKIIYIEESNIRKIYQYNEKTGYSQITVKPYYHIKIQKRKENNNLKSFRFLLHSVSKKATNTLTSNYFIDGIEIPENEFKFLSRKVKINSIL